MTLDLEDFRRLLRAVLQDPARADLLVEAVARAALSGEDALQRAILEELERAITQASAESRPFGRRLKGPTRIDVLMLSPGGVVLKGQYHGKSVLADMLNCVVDEGRYLKALTEPPFAPHFQAVRDGRSDAAWFDFDHGQAGFAAVHPQLNGEAPEKPDSLFAIFVTPDKPEETRRDPAPKVAPIALASEMRRFNPAKAKSVRDWQIAPPDRRIVRLRDGRAISTRWYGARDATPVFYFGVIHKSTTACAFLANAAIAHGLGLLVIERPGLGASDSAPVTSYEAVANDVAEIRRALDFADVLIYGEGSAASFALATAHRLGTAARAVGLYSPRVGRPSAEAPSAYGRVMWALLKNPSGLDVLARLLRHLRVAGSAQSLIQNFSATNERDRRILNELGMLSYYAAQTNDAVCNSVEGALAEFRLYQSGARFDPALVTQPIRIWHGAENRTMFAEDIARAFAGAPNAQIDIVPGGGVLIDPSEADATIRWLAEGWKAQIAGQMPAAD